jgi:hypothetical protein
MWPVDKDVLPLTSPVTSSLYNIIRFTSMHHILTSDLRNNVGGYSCDICIQQRLLHGGRRSQLLLRTSRQPEFHNRMALEGIIGRL